MANTVSNNRISNLINTQVPFFVRNDHRNFVAFLEAYYEYLEQHSKVVNTAKSLLNYQNIDITEDQYAERLYATFMKYIPADIKADKALLLKNIKDFYRAKGTENSIKFLLNLINNVQSVDFYYPKDDVLRASDGKWFIQRSLRIDDIRINGVPSPTIEHLRRFINTKIVSDVTGTTAIVESVDRFFEEEALINELILSNIDGRFRNGEVVTGQYEEEGEVKTLTAIVYNFVIDKITIVDPGRDYRVNDPIIITSNTGSGACVYVSSVTVGEVTDVEVIDGGAGYRAGDVLTFVGQTTTGVHAAANVATVNTDEKYHPNSYMIDDTQILLEANTTIGNSSTNEYETYAYQNLATLFVESKPNITNLFLISSTSNKINLNRIANRSNVGYGNNSPITINGQTNIIEPSSNLLSNTINVFPGFTGNVVNSSISFYTTTITSNLYANTGSGSTANTITLFEKVLTLNTSNLNVSSLDVGNTVYLTQHSGNSNVFFTVGHIIRVNGVNTLVTSANANSLIIKTSPALFGTLTSNVVQVYEISYPNVYIGNSNVFLTTGNTISLNGKNTYIISSSAESNTINVYPGVDSNLSLVAVQVFSETRTSNLRVSAASANNIRFSENPANSNVYFTLYDKLNVSGQLLTITQFTGSNGLITVPEFNIANANISGVIIIRPPYNESSNLTISTWSGSNVRTLTLSDIKANSNVFFETFDSINVGGQILTVTSSNTISNTIGVSLPGLPGDQSGLSFSVIKKPNVNTVIANSLIYFDYSETGPITSIRITNGGGYFEPPTATVAANTKVVNRGILGKMTIIDGGKNYSVGDVIEFINPVGTYGLGAEANVTNVAANGMIQEVKFKTVSGQITGGSGYQAGALPTVNVISTSGGSNANIIVSLLGSGAVLRPKSNKLGQINGIFIQRRGAGYEDAAGDLTQSGDGTAKVNIATFAGDIFGVFSYPGRYLNDDGHVSSYNFLQDRDYYQNFSYVVKAPLSISKYRSALKDLIHPSGMKLFGEFTLIDSTDSVLDGNANTEIITIYTSRTYDKIGNTINVSYTSHGMNVGNTVYLEFTSGAVGNVENGIYSISKSNTNYFEVIQKSKIKSVTILNAGRNYNANSFLVFTGGNGNGANGKFTINSAGSIISVNIADYGINYTTAPTVRANGTNSVSATFTVTLEYANNTSGTVDVGKIRV